MSNSEKFVRLYKVDKNIIPHVMPLGKENVFTVECFSQHTGGLKVLNTSDIERSMRINPMQRRYIHHLEDFNILAKSLFEAVPNKDVEFYANNAVSLITATMYFLMKYGTAAHDRCGRVSSIPHLVTFLGKEYKTILEVLNTETHLRNILKPLMDAFRNKAYEQVEKVFSAARTQLSCLSGKEVMWIMVQGQDDFLLDEGTKYIAIVGNENQTNIDKIFTLAVLKAEVMAEPMPLSKVSYIAQCVDKKRYLFDNTPYNIEKAMDENCWRINKDIDDMVEKTISPN